MSLQSGYFEVNASVGETLAVPEDRSGTIFDSIRQSYSFTNGVIAGTNNLIWSDRRTVAAGVTDTIDLNGGGLTDAFGVAVNFASVTGICIFNRETVINTRTLNFRPAAAATFLWTFGAVGNTIAIAPSGAYIQWDDVVGGHLSPGGADSLSLVNTDGANGVTYDILIIGRT